MDDKTYLKSQVAKLISGLDASQEPVFGLMTPQHMVEHLIWVTKSSIKDMGPAPDLGELSEGQQKFMHFVKSGKPMQYRPSDKTKADLSDLRMPSLQAAIEELNVAVDRLVSDYDSRGDKPYYNPMMGVLTPDDMMSFHKRHYLHHLENQFELKALA